MQMTVAVSLTLCSVDRRGNSKDLSGSTAELTARAAPAINILANNNHGCLFFPKLSVSMTDLFWKCLLFWQISGADSDCSLSVCCVRVDAVSATCTEMESTGCERLKQQWHHGYMAFLKMCFSFHESAHIFFMSLFISEMDKYRVNRQPSPQDEACWLLHKQNQQVRVFT